MSLVLTNYTSFEIVRGLLGVSEPELPDDVFTTLSNSMLQEVVFSLEELNSTLPTLFETVKNITPSTRTGAQQRFYDIVQFYAAYTVADRFANGAVAMFAPMKITDGKAEQQRVKDPYTALRTALAASLMLWRKRLNTALQVLDPTQLINTTTAVLVGSAGLASDPVTGV